MKERNKRKGDVRMAQKLERKRFKKKMKQLKDYSKDKRG